MDDQAFEIKDICTGVVLGEMSFVGEVSLPAVLVLVTNFAAEVIAGDSTYFRIY
jgi:hypothetical protein